MRGAVVGIAASIGIWVLGGCAATSEQAPAPGQQVVLVSPATAPAATQQADVTVVRVYHMADAQALKNFESTTDQMQLIYRVQLVNVRSKPTIFFGEVHTRQNEATVGAFIAQDKNGSLQGLILNDPTLVGCGWEWVGGGPGAGEVWGILDSQDDSGPDNLALVHSTDGGANWELAMLRKPVYYATFADFAMAGDGHGRISLYVEGDYKGSVKAGYYHYRTLDGGKTWSAPQWEKDEMTAGEQVPDSQQPEAAQGL
jgi:hypothetical protein